MKIAARLQRLAKLVEARAKFKVTKMETVRNIRHLYVEGILSVNAPLAFTGDALESEIYDEYGDQILTSCSDYLARNADGEVNIEPDLNWAQPNRTHVPVSTSKRSTDKKLVLNFFLDNEDLIMIGETP